jgi:hypothetical protein
MRGTSQIQSQIAGVALLALALVAGCEEVSKPAQEAQCASSAECPAAQVCSGGECVATCLAGPLCPSADHASGALRIAETDEDGGAIDVAVLAAFAPAGAADGAPMAIGGTDCIAVPADPAQRHGALSAGTIHVDGALAGSSEPLGLEPTSETGQVVYANGAPVGSRLAHSGTIAASAEGADFPPFDVEVPVPAPIAGFAVATEALVWGEPFEVEWIPTNASQMVLMATGPAHDPELGRLTVVCPARDEAGRLALPAAVSQWFAPGPIEMSLERRAVVVQTLDGGARVTATAGFVLCWTEPLDPAAEKADRTPSPPESLWGAFVP